MNSSELQRYFQSAKFSLSAAKLSQCPLDEIEEVAFAGRSNAGKSSAINRLTGQKKLARTSKTPGRTQLINFFALQDQKRLVDLPGYGYAKVSMEKKIAWQKHLEDYLENRHTLKALVLITDIRHPLQKFDQIMVDWAKSYQMPLHIVLTKADKLNRGAAKNTLLKLAQSFGAEPHITSQVFSATAGTGVDQLRETIYQLLHPEQPS